MSLDLNKQPSKDFDRIMTDEKKKAALEENDADAQMSWFVEECLEFEATGDNSPEQLNEATDVIGCVVKFAIHFDDAMLHLQNIQKNYILTKVIMLLSRVSDRNKLYRALNERASSRGRKQFNPTDLERAFINYKKQLQK